MARRLSDDFRELDNPEGHGAGDDVERTVDETQRTDVKELLRRDVMDAKLMSGG